MGSPLGLGRLHNGQVERFGHQDGLLDGEAPGSLFEDHRGRIWASTNREFGYLERDRFIPVRTVPGGYVFAIVEDSEGDLWVMNQQRGVLRLHGEAVREIPWAALGHSGSVSSRAASRISLATKLPLCIPQGMAWRRARSCTCASIR